MDETKYRRDHVIPELKSWGFDVQHHEDRVYADIPDLSFAFEGTVDGWIELKYSADLPKTSFKHKSFTSGQQTWLRARATAGTGHCFLLWGTEDRHVMLQAYLFNVYVGAPVSKLLRDANRTPGLIVKPTLREVIKVLRLALGGR